MWRELVGRLTLHRAEATHEEDAQDDAPERPKVYIADNGARYVKADEVFASKRGQKLLEQWARDLDRSPDAKSNCRRVTISGGR